MPFVATPSRAAYDVVIIGGAIMGSSTAWWLSRMDPTLSVLVVERDPSFAACSTAHTNSCIRQQFSTALNIRISQFTADFIRDLPASMGNDPRVPDIAVQDFGYLYLADTESFADVLRDNARLQHAYGTPTQLLTPDEIAARYPFYALEDIVLGSINTRDEGYWDGATVFDWFRRQAMETGVEYCAGEVTGLTLDATRVTGVTLASGAHVACGQVVNAAGPRAAHVAAMVGISLPVEPRKRFTYIFKAAHPLDRPLPLTINPSGVHVREVGGGTYLAGGHPDNDPAADPADFEMDHGFWQDHVWPILAARIPAFEAVKLQAEWAGHYAYNTLDQNAITGPHPEITNFLFLNGFSGHGLQQSPAMGRATAEWLVYGAYQTLDMTEFHFDRVIENRPILERAVI